MFFKAAFKAAAGDCYSIEKLKSGINSHVSGRLICTAVLLGHPADSMVRRVTEYRMPFNDESNLENRANEGNGFQHFYRAMPADNRSKKNKVNNQNAARTGHRQTCQGD